MEGETQKIKNKIIVCRGNIASGKTTWALQYLRDNLRTKRFNRDELRSMIDGGAYSKDNESFLINLRDKFIREAIKYGYDVILDDTNLNPWHIDQIRRNWEYAEGEAEIVIVDHFLKVPLEECIKRDKQRGLSGVRSVGEEVITNMYNKYIKDK